MASAGPISSRPRVTCVNGSPRIDLQSFVKLTGGKGLHVVLPISGADWRTTKNFAQTVALAMTADAPARYVAKITKSLRRGKIFIDYLRNSLEQTSVAAYSTRARRARRFRCR